MNRPNKTSVRKKAPTARKALPYLALVFGAAVLWGCSGGEQKSNPSAAAPSTPAQQLTGRWENGKVIYERYCHFCHGVKGYGDGPVGIAITPHPADFVNDDKRMAKTDKELFDSITAGIHRAIGGEEMAMPRWQDILTPQERWDVLAYIRRLHDEGKKEQQAGKK